MKALLVVLTTLISLSTFAQTPGAVTPAPTPVPTGAARDTQIKNIFNDIKKLAKGALDLNVYQTPTGRVIVMQNGVIIKPPADTLITVAFRNPKAQQLAALDFYIGNRFGSNYWELNNRVNATPEQQDARAFNFNHPALLTHPEGLPFALSMARHQVLELFYMANSPTSNLTKSYNQRGVADADNELKFYRLYADYLARTIQYDNEYLQFVDFQKNSAMLPGKKTVSLAQIRQLVAQISTKFDTYLQPQPASDFRSLRNSIHNGMSKSVIQALAQFKAANAASILPEDIASYDSLVSMITTYYAIDKDLMGVLLPQVKADLPGFSDALSHLQSTGNSLSSLLALSQWAVTAKQKFYVTRNLDLTHLIIRIQEFIDAELGSQTYKLATDLGTKAQILTNVSFATGYISSARYSQISDQLKVSPDAAIPALSQTLSEGVQAYESAYEPALRDWKLVSTSVTSFVDDAIRSSSLIGLDSTLTQLKTLFPNAAGPAAGNFSIENPGVGYGYLKLIPRAQTDQLTPTLTYQMIPVFETLPLDLGVVAAVITEEPQTPLSHVAIKSKNRGTPNLYLKDAASDVRFKDLIAKGALVRLELKDGTISVREAGTAEAQAFWSAQQNAKPAIVLRADLNEKRIRTSDQIGFADSLSVGVKAANYAEGYHFLPDAFRIGGAIPFFYYREFINTNKFDANETLSQHIFSLMQNPRIKTDRQFLTDELAALQKRMNDDDMVVNPDLVAQVKAIGDKYYPGQKMRLRSSTNSEDMPQFSGAGLYDSDAYDPTKPKKTIQKALKFVWSSVWNLRAYDERELFRINHLDVSMGILISPAYPDEVANGVGVSRNIIDPKLGAGVYLNIQKGSEAVTNPDPNMTPDQILVLLKPDTKAKTKYTLKYIKYSSLTKTEPVLPYAEVEKITDYLLQIQDHFKKIYDPKAQNPKFALDVEFKVDTTEGSRKVHYKQARPYVGQ